MTALTVKDLRGKYDLFNTGDIDAIVALFAPNAEYRQLDGERPVVSRGLSKIYEVMEGWGYYFGSNRSIESITIREAHGLAADVPGAAQCFVIDFIAVGVYRNTFPGLERVARAHHRPVRVPTGETVWVNDKGKFVRVENTMQITALQ